MAGYGSIDSVDGDTSDGMRKTRRYKKIVKLTYSNPDKPRTPSILVGVAYDVENKHISVNTFGAVLPDVTSEVDLNTSETDVEDHGNYQPNILEPALERTICYNPRRRKKPSVLTVVLLSVLTILSNCALLILCPIYMMSTRRAGGTPCDPTRTPSSIQPVLTCSFILFTVVASFIALKKGKMIDISKRRLLCCLVALLAVFIGIDPKIWPFQSSSEPLFTSDYLAEKILWPAIYSANYLPLTFYYVAVETELRKNVV
ncbi:hypothetical protein Btru_078029 [Bulinus truncatus]|nr:hypothetical protein Btru_078029 [Bulinus truncatus]